MRKHWFKADVVVYDLLRVVNGQAWSDPSYGNGGGDYIPFEAKEVIYSFKTIKQALNFKKEILTLKNQKTCQE